MKNFSAEAEKQDILKRFHEDPLLGGHPGITRMINKIRRYFYWKNLTKYVSKYVKNCVTCKINKTTKHTKEPLIITPTPAKPFHTVVIDTIGPLPITEHSQQYIVTIVCDLTKYLITIPIPNKTAKTIAKAIFENLFLIYGPVHKILTDMGTEYKNEIFQELLKLLNVELVNSTPHHHETVGTVERSHRTFNEFIRLYISKSIDNWDQWLPYFTYCYNTTPSTTHKYCPFELVFGKTPEIFSLLNHKTIEPIYNFDDYVKEVKYKIKIANENAKTTLERLKQQQKLHYDKTANQINIKTNDQVLVRNEKAHKLQNVYTGPYKVINIDNNNNCILLTDKNKEIKIHRNRLKLANKH